MNLVQGKHLLLFGKGLAAHGEEGHRHGDPGVAGLALRHVAHHLADAGDGGPDEIRVGGEVVQPTVDVNEGRLLEGHVAEGELAVVLGRQGRDNGHARGRLGVPGDHGVDSAEEDVGLGHRTLPRSVFQS